MKITFADQTIDFRPWRPEDGAVFDGTFAFDTETTLIDEAAPWLTPAYVLGAASDGHRGVFVTRNHVREFFEKHEGVAFVLHNAAFDLDVVDTLAPTLDIYRWVDDDLVWDTQLLHQLFWIGKHGDPSRGKGRSTLEHCVRHYLGAELPKDVVDSQGDAVRLSYAKWLDRPPFEIERVYLEYLAKDAMATWLVYQRLREELESLLTNQESAFGFVSSKWLKQQQRRWGPQTHHIQVKAAVVLHKISKCGLHIDPQRRDQLEKELKAAVQVAHEQLRGYGYLAKGEGSQKALQEILRRLERDNPHLRFPRTDTGKYATSKDALQDLVADEPFIATLMQYRNLDKFLSTYLSKMGRSVIRASFATLTSSGRTSSFGEINAQNLPREDGIRSCFIPLAGHVFLDADYTTLEMATLAQSVQSQLNLRSHMAEAINKKQDLHRLIAARVTGKAIDQVSKDDRQRAKVINFGKPGGMGHNGLKNYAKTGYGLELSDEEVETLSDAWDAAFPEMEAFLGDENDLGLSVATALDLTPLTYFEHTGSRSFLDHPENFGASDVPHKILGWMCLKCLKEERPCKKNEAPYAAEEIDYFWTQVTARLDEMPVKHHAAIRNRQTSPALWRAVANAADRGSVFTLTGRLRANASFCARHNTVFQGLAADGAKLGLWLVWRAGYRIVNFIHDELLVEVPDDGRLRLHAEIVRKLMCDGMRLVVPDVRIDVEYAVTDRWYKSGNVVVDEQGRLQPYSIDVPTTVA